MIGVAGCGRMGGPMLIALRRAGLDAIGYDVRATGVDGCFQDADAFRHRITTLLTVVRDIAQTDEVLFGAQHFLDAPHLSRLIICSTLSPTYLQALPDRLPRPLTLIDAPMSGAQVAAEQARLSFMLGGTEDDLDAAHPLFAAMGTNFHRMGPFGSGMQAKVLNNLLAASHVAMTRLVLDWADHAGLDEVALRALIHSSSGQNWFASGFDDIEFARDGFAPDNTIAILVKDIRSALDAAPADANTDLPELIQKRIAALTPRPPLHLAR